MSADQPLTADVNDRTSTDMSVELFAIARDALDQRDALACAHERARERAHDVERRLERAMVN
jgi:hypothetical protein